MSRIGIYGGSFNPPHMGHLSVVMAALASDGFDEIRIVPCFHHAFAKDRELIPFEHRMEMCRLAFNQWTNVYVSDMSRRIKNRYSIDLAQALKEMYPDDQIIFIVGSDVYAERTQWRDIEFLEQLVSFRVFERFHNTVPHPLMMSSSWIRKQLQAADYQAPLMQSMPMKVWSYILQEKLYPPKTISKG